MAIGPTALLLAFSSLLLGPSAFAEPSQQKQTSPTATARVVQTAAEPVIVTMDLCAKAGSLSLPGTDPVDVWGFAVGADCLAAAQVPGPTINANVGDVITITLHNTLSDDVALHFPGQSVVETPGLGESKVYTLTPASPGTYLYEAGGENAPTQVPMGLYGALVVGSGTAGQAYGSGASAYERQAVLVLSEIDPAFNADPSGATLLHWAPKYWLINGKPYPETAEIAAEAGDRVLLRYANAGIDHHTMALLGLHQRVFAKDATPLNFPFDAVSETLPAGQTADMIVTIPVGTATGTKYPVYSRNLNVTNGDAFPGGMLTFIEVQETAGPPVIGVGPRFLSLRTAVRGHTVRVIMREANCRPCRAQAKLRVRGVWRKDLMEKVAPHKFVGVFKDVPNGRWSYFAAMRDLDSGIKVTSARHKVRVG
jgi:FtsP/CotA-like multicopper oxidase with cupredoxin domain